MVLNNVLVTGGAGFIGSHLCERLIQQGCNVHSLDNYFTGSTDNHISGVKYIKGETVDIEYALGQFHPEIIFHLGEYSRVEQSFEDNNLVHRYNIQGTYAVLEYVRKHCCKLVYAGSSTKFGDGGLGRNSSPYAFSKAYNTELVVNYGAWYNIPYAITYFYNVYGPKEINQGKYATLIGLFKNLTTNDQPLTVVAPGTQQRNFTHINDVIDALILIAENGHGDEFGIGADESFSVLEVAELFKGKIQMLPERPGNRLISEVTVEKTKSLGWTPKIKLQDHVREFLNTHSKK